jgi:hypothetical protein
MERLEVSKQAKQNFEIEDKEKYQLKMSNSFAALENLDDDVVDLEETSAKESLGYCVLKQHKPWFDEGCPELLDQRKQAKLQ